MVDSDGRSREYRAWLRCQKCRACYYGTSEEYFFDDDFIFSLYAAETAGWERSLERALKCPHAQDDECACAAHKTPAEGVGKLLRYTPTFYPKGDS
jgi:hypothetical protein